MTRRAAQVGFGATAATWVFAEAEIGSGTFYKLYATREACLQEAFECCAETIFARVAAAGREGGDDFASRLNAGLGELLELLASEPEVARLVLVEIRVGGAECREAEQRWLNRFAELLADAGGGSAAPAGIGLARMAVGALVASLTLATVEEGPQKLPELLGELAGVALWFQRGTAAAASFEAATAAGGMPRAAKGRDKAIRPLQRRAERELLLAAIVEVATAKGFEATRVVEVLKRSGLSKFSFYAHFADKEECFLAAVDAGIAQLAERTEAAIAEGGTPAERTEAGLRSLLDSLAAQPGLAQVLTIEVRKAGAAGEARYREALARLAQAFTEASGDRQAAGEVPELVVASAIAREVGEGRAGQLERLLPELLFTALAPCLGGEQAAAEMRRVAGAQG